MNPSLLNGLAITAFGVILAALIGLVIRQDTRLSKLEMKVSNQAVKIEPLWKRVQDQISNELHHPDPRFAEMDELLEQLENLSISVTGRERLKVLLVERSSDMEVRQGQRNAAVLMLTVMEKAVLDDVARSEASKLEPPAYPELERRQVAKAVEIERQKGDSE